ncbi:unnamed protein product [Rhizophagus irregularis]|nr:unnamed protein product [Rhizophagus irregularis]
MHTCAWWESIAVLASPASRKTHLRGFGFIVSITVWREDACFFRILNLSICSSISEWYVDQPKYYHR